MNIGRLANYLTKRQEETAEPEYEAILEQLRDLGISGSGWARLSRSFPWIRGCSLVAVGLVYYTIFGFVVAMLMVVAVLLASFLLECEIDRMAGCSEAAITELKNCRKISVHPFWNHARRKQIKLKNKAVKKKSERKPLDKKRLARNALFIVIVLSIVFLLSR